MQKSVTSAIFKAHLSRYCSPCENTYCLRCKGSVHYQLMLSRLASGGRSKELIFINFVNVCASFNGLQMSDPGRNSE